MQITLTPKLTLLLSNAKAAKKVFTDFHEGKPWDFSAALEAFHAYVKARNALDTALNGKVTVEQLGG